MDMRDKKVTFIVQAAVIAALYVVLTFVANALGLASHTIQVRFSEALCILPVFTPAAIPGLWIGCLLANLLTGAVIYDVFRKHCHAAGSGMYLSAAQSQDCMHISAGYF